MATTTRWHGHDGTDLPVAVAVALAQYRDVVDDLAAAGADVHRPAARLALAHACSDVAVAVGTDAAAELGVVLGRVATTAVCAGTRLSAGARRLAVAMCSLAHRFGDDLDAALDACGDDLVAAGAPDPFLLHVRACLLSLSGRHREAVAIAAPAT